MTAPIDPATVPADALARLCVRGFGVDQARRMTSAERTALLERERESMHRPTSLAAFSAACTWLRQFSKTEKINKIGTSYGLKHVWEADIGYIANGVFIAAALAEGFRVERCSDDSLNCWINISKAAWRRGSRRAA
jgi:hypothetical protein